MPARTICIPLTLAEIRLLLDGLDSHVYWDLSDEACRSSGFVVGDGSDDPEHRAEILRARDLAQRLNRACLARARAPRARRSRRT